jgi:hypothetical protein
MKIGGFCGTTSRKKVNKYLLRKGTHRWTLDTDISAISDIKRLTYQLLSELHDQRKVIVFEGSKRLVPPNQVPAPPGPLPAPPNQVPAPPGPLPAPPNQVPAPPGPLPVPPNQVPAPPGPLLLPRF